MNGYLKQSTASQVRTIGPFVDDTDFKTLETALTIANTDIKIKKNGGTAASKNSGGATADSTTGLYHLTWGTNDTDTVGELSVSVKVAGALVYFCTYTVLEEAVYDMLFGASATGYISDTTRASQTSVDAIAAKTTNLPSDPADASDIAASFTSLNTKVDTIDDFLDTEVAAIKLSTDHLATAMEVDGAVYRFTQNALELAPGSGSQGQGNGGTLRFDDIWKWTTAGSVSSGQIRGNVTDWNTITELWIHNVTNGTTNLSAYLRVVKADDTVRVQQENNPATWNSYLVTGAVVDMTTWVKIPVSLRASAAVSSPATATNCLVSFFRPNNLDWTDTERSQIRHRLGIDGTTTAPSTGDPSLASEADLTSMAASTATSFAGVNTKLDTIDDFVDTEIGAIKAKTDQLVFTSGKVDANATVTLTPTDLNAMADALLKRDWNSVTGEAAYSALNAFRMLRNVWNTTGGTLSVKKEDGTTNAWQRTLAVDPTAQPIVGAS